MSNRIRSRVLCATLALAATVSFTSCGGETLDPGETHLVRDSKGNTQVVTSGRSYSYGRDKRFILKTAPRTMPMNLQVLCGEDAINMTIAVNWVGQFDALKQEGQDDNAYKGQIAAIIASATAAKGESAGSEGTITLEPYWTGMLKPFAEEEAKQVFSKYEPGAMNDSRKEMADAVEQAIAARFKELAFPVRTLGVNLTNLDFPDEIDQQRKDIANMRLQDSLNAAQAEADVAAARRLAELMAEKGEARLVEAEKEAAYFMKLAEALDDKVLILRRLEAAETISNNMLEAAKAASQSGSSTIVITPFGGQEMLGASGEGDLVLREALKRGVQ